MHFLFLCNSLFLTCRQTPIFTFDFFGEFDPVRVRERARLLVNVVDVQHFAHELNDWLGLVEGGGRDCKIKQGQELFKTKKQQG